MQLLYNSDQFAVMAFEMAGDDAVASRPAEDVAAAPLPILRRGGFEIVDKRQRKEIFIEGAVAEHFHQGVQALVERADGPDEESLDEFIAGYTVLAQQPLRMH